MEKLDLNKAETFGLIAIAGVVVYIVYQATKVVSNVATGVGSTINEVAQTTGTTIGESAAALWLSITGQTPAVSNPDVINAASPPWKQQGLGGTGSYQPNGTQNTSPDATIYSPGNGPQVFGGVNAETQANDQAAAANGIQ